MSAKSKYNKNVVIVIASIAATGGLLFGFDTGVISGAIPFLQDYFELTDSQVENLTALGLIGAVVGALVTGRITDYLGRKKVILASAFVFATGAVWTGFAPTVTQLMISRFYLGLAIGVSSFAVPLYISEISPTKIRGTLVSMFQLLITVGILGAYLSDNALADNRRDLCHQAFRRSAFWENRDRGKHRGSVCCSRNCSFPPADRGSPVDQCRGDRSAAP